MGRRLIAAARKGDEAEVRALLDAGAAVDAKDIHGWTALHRAIVWGRAAVVAAMIEAGADVEAKDQSERTALHWASWHGRAAVVEMLLAAGADVDAKDIYGATPLATPPWSDEEGATPGDVAARRGHAAVVELLRAAPAGRAGQSGCPSKADASRPASVGAAE